MTTPAAMAAPISAAAMVAAATSPITQCEQNNNGLLAEAVAFLIRAQHFGKSLQAVLVPLLPDADEPLPMEPDDELPLIPAEPLPLIPAEPLVPAEPLPLNPDELLPLMPELLPLAPAEPPADPLVDGEDVEAEPDPEAEPDAAVFSFGCPVA